MLKIRNILDYECM